MLRRPPRSTRTDTLFPYTTLFRSTRRLVLEQGFSPQLVDALGQRLERGEQSLIFLNRRGYAPVLNCKSCGWVSQCPRCTAYAVLHRRGGRHKIGRASGRARVCPYV